MIEMVVPVKMSRREILTELSKRFVSGLDDDVLYKHVTDLILDYKRLDDVQFAQMIRDKHCLDIRTLSKGRFYGFMRIKI